MFYFRISQNSDFIKKIESVHYWYFQAQLFHSRQINPQPLILYHQEQVNKPNYSYPNQATTERQRTIWGSDDPGEGDTEPDINLLALDNLRQLTSVHSQCELSPWT